MTSGSWDFWIDRGGTFTDVVARTPDGRLLTAKLLSENPEQYPDAALQAIRCFLGLSPEAAIPPDRIGRIKMGTTVAINALLERKGAPTVLVTTRGLGQQLRLAYQNRPDLFARRIVLPEMLYSRVIEADERVRADGTVECPLNEDGLRSELVRAWEAGFRAIAIVFIHGYRYRGHEARAAAIAREMGFPQVSVSHEVSPLMKMVSRGDTTVVDAYLSPILRAYVDRIAAAFEDRQDIGAKLMFMQSSGGLTDARLFRGKDAILSGPAGGVVGCVRTSEIAGFNRVIGFDMGGTSTDVCHYAGTYERVFNTLIAGVRVTAPMLAIHTVAAGGGSLLRFDGTRLRVGPESAGAVPGPACYGRGGPLTVTDANVVLGKLRPEFFPAVFGPGADRTLAAAAARSAFEALAAKIGKPVAELADGFIRIAVENMANAIKKISVQQGHNVTEYCLAVFGGAGAQHACLIADVLGIRTCLIHPFASLLSAYGMGLADIRAARQQAIEAELSEAACPLAEAALERIGADAVGEVKRQGVPPARIRLNRTVLLKVKGTDTSLPIAFGAPAAMRAAFAEAHRRRFGFNIGTDAALVIEAVSAEAVGAAADLSEERFATATRPETAMAVARTAPFYSKGAWHEARFVRREAVRPGDSLTGPAVLVEPHTAIVIEPGWRAEITAYDHVLLHPIGPREAAAVGTQADPVMLEVFNNLFMSIAEQMGAVLENTAASVNIKERLDFSCAVFDKAGDLVANAPHMPVHLGSMAASVRAVIAGNPGMRPGDVFVLNAPYDGGTHLPDITVITPVWNEEGTEVRFFTSARGHHTDVGGLTPGSMPPDSRVVEEEGVLIDNALLVDGPTGRFCETEIRALLTASKYPARAPDTNIADLKAQVGACREGASELRRMVAHFGLDVVRAYMGHVQDNAEELVRARIEALSDSKYIYRMDPGLDGNEREIRVHISVDRSARSATIDFTGTTAQLADNYNAPEPVTRAAVLYVFRCLVDDAIPMNEGVMRPLSIILPKGTMLSPAYPAAVSAGNVETSQAVTSALFLALGVQAAAQSTMNNTTWGNAKYQYYETVCGGSGAGVLNDGSGHPGTSGVHTHMTNSRLTDPEVLEWRFPVVLEQFAIREGSGGAGRFPGGCGTIRRIRFLEPMTIAILSGHRVVPPPGLAGAEPGALGRTRILRADGTVEELKAADKRDIGAGDIYLLETPGGGGWGRP